MKLLRLFIRETLTRLYEKKVLSEPDNNEGEEQEEAITLAAAGITGFTGPIGDDTMDPPKKKKKKSDVRSHAFGGGEFKE